MTHRFFLRVCYQLVARLLPAPRAPRCPMLASVPWPNANRTSKQHYRMAKRGARLVQFKQSNIRFVSVTVCLQMFMQIQCRRSKVICLCAHLISSTTLTLKMSPLGPWLGRAAVRPHCCSQLGRQKLSDSIACFRVVMAPFRRRSTNNIQDKSTSTI